MAGTMGVDDAVEILRRTPSALGALLTGLPRGWAEADEGPGTFSPFEVLGHLLHGERTDWMPRARRILEQGEAVAFEPFDRFAHREASRGKTMDDLLEEFAVLRRENLEALARLGLGPADLGRRGRHPALGTVTLGQLLATWAAHDLDHLAQVARVMAKRCGPSVGPWREYLPVLADRTGPAGRDS